MPIRRNVEDALTRVLMEKRGLRFHFGFGEPVVHDAQDNLVDPRIYVETQELAAELYRTVLCAIDFNRLALEAVSAWMAFTEIENQDKPHVSREFGDNAYQTGTAIWAALTADDTFPDWETLLRSKEMKW